MKTLNYRNIYNVICHETEGEDIEEIHGLSVRTQPP
jgi:hypothetical protein